MTDSIVESAVGPLHAREAVRSADQEVRIDSPDLAGSGLEATFPQRARNGFGRSCHPAVILRLVAQVRRRRLRPWPKPPRISLLRPDAGDPQGLGRLVHVPEFLQPCSLHVREVLRGKSDEMSARSARFLTSDSPAAPAHAASGKVYPDSGDNRAGPVHKSSTAQKTLLSRHDAGCEAGSTPSTGFDAS